MLKGFNILLNGGIVLMIISSFPGSVSDRQSSWYERGYQQQQPISRYHPSTFAVHHGQQNQPDLDAEGDTQHIQYAYQGGESHEGEVVNHGEEMHEQDYQQEGSSYQPQTYSPPHASYPYSGYHYQPPHHPLPPPPPPHRPPPPPPHKSKQHESAPYTYYYIGRHLWYIPLYFSIYFIVYVGLLVLKSIARHKVLFPEKLQEAAAGSTSRENHALRSIEEGPKRYYYM